MTDQQHAITPPPELVQQWDEECDSRNNSEINNTFDALQHFASKAARWGADQELEACCEWFDKHLAYKNNVTDNLRAARRPKPPSLKEQALWELADAYNLGQIDDSTYDTIRKALKALPND